MYLGIMFRDLIVVKVEDEGAKRVLSRHLARDPSISLEKASSMLDNLPVAYLRNATEKEIAAAAQQLDSLGVGYTTVESKGTPDSIGPTPLPDAEPEPVMSPIPERKPETTRVRHLPDQRIVLSGGGSSPEAPAARTVSGTWAKALGVIAVLGVAGLILYLGGKKRYDLKPIGPIGSGRGASRGSHRKPASGRRQTTAPRSSRKSVSAQAKASANALIDSAARYTDDYGTMIKFYKIAISFNEHNVQAWQGLISAYRSAGMDPQVDSVLAEFTALFGKDVVSVERMVARYGVLTDYATGADGTCRLEYSSRSRKSAALEKEVFELCRALAGESRCSAISLYATTGKGTGMLVHIRATPFPPTRSAFVKAAMLTYLE